MIELNDNIIYILLQERTTNSNLNVNLNTTIPRYMKSYVDKKNRTKSKAEVFTPIRIIKIMNDSLDDNYTGTNEEYIDRKVMEITCGEAPFLTTRYDTNTGEQIPYINRVGLLDRKLKHIPDNIDKTEWIKFATKSLQATYGYEWQEDSIYLARKNLLLDVIEFYEGIFNEHPEDKVIEEWANIVSYNIFRMDGVTLCIPQTDIKSKVMNWGTNIFENFDGSKDFLKEVEQSLF